MARTGSIGMKRPIENVTAVSPSTVTNSEAINPMACLKIRKRPPKLLKRSS